MLGLFPESGATSVEFKAFINATSSGRYHAGHAFDAYFAVEKHALKTPSITAFNRVRSCPHSLHLRGQTGGGHEGRLPGCVRAQGNH